MLGSTNRSLGNFSEYQENNIKTPFSFNIPRLHPNFKFHFQALK
jgi:hypothetical protein